MKFLIDAYDKILLTLIQKNARLSQNELGEHANLSATAVNRRLKTLTEQGIIEGYVAKLNAELLGFGLTIITEVKLERENKQLLQELERQFWACPSVQQCYYVAGECDFVLIFLVENMSQYVALAEQLFQENNNIKSYKTLTVMKKIKAELAIGL